MTHRIGILISGDPTPLLQPLSTALNELAGATAPGRGQDKINLLADPATIAAWTALRGLNAADCVWEPASLIAAPARDLEGSLRYLMLHCQLLVVVCPSPAAKPKIEHVLDGSWMLVKWVFLDGSPVQQGESRPQYTALDPADWKVRVNERWSEPALKVGASTALWPMTWPFRIVMNLMLVEFKTSKPSTTGLDVVAIDSAAVKKLDSSDVAALKVSLEPLINMFNDRDRAGVGHADAFRSACVVIPFGIAAAALVAAIAFAFPGPLTHLFHWLEFGLLALALLAYLAEKASHYHRNWVVNRLDAELLRPAGMQYLCAMAPALALPAHHTLKPGDTKHWNECVQRFWHQLRQLPVQPFATPLDELVSARRSAVHQFVQGQIHYHHGFAERHMKVHERLVGLAFSIFVLTFLVCVANLIGGLLPHAGLPGAALAVTGLSAAFLALVVSVVAHQLGFEAIVQRSQAAAVRYQELEHTIDREKALAKSTQVAEWQDRCFAIYADEQRSWYRHIPFMKLHLG